MAPFRPGRRAFFGAGAGGAAGILAWLAARKAPAAAAALAQPRAGYRLTEHVRRYYARANL